MPWTGHGPGDPTAQVMSDGVKEKVRETNAAEIWGKRAAAAAPNPAPFRAGKRDASAQKSLLFEGRVRGGKTQN